MVCFIHRTGTSVESYAVVNSPLAPLKGRVVSFCKIFKVSQIALLLNAGRRPANSTHERGRSRDDCFLYRMKRPCSKEELGVSPIECESFLFLSIN